MFANINDDLYINVKNDVEFDELICSHNNIEMYSS